MREHEWQPTCDCGWEGVDRSLAYEKALQHTRDAHRAPAVTVFERFRYVPAAQDIDGFIHYRAGDKDTGRDIDPRDAIRRGGYR